MKLVTRISQKITEQLIKLETISENDSFIYSYGIEMLINTAISYVCCIIFGFIFKVPVASVIYLTAFLFIRTYTGGFHFENATICFFFSIAEIAISVFLISFIGKWRETIGFSIISFLAVLIIFIISPVDTPNKELDVLEKQVYGKKAKISTCICVLFAIVSIFVKLPTIQVALQIAIISSALTGLWGLIANMTRKI